jgi:hypothetical protein
MENKIFSGIAIGFVVNMIIISLIANCYVNFTSFNEPLKASKGESVINISGY